MGCLIGTAISTILKTRLTFVMLILAIAAGAGFQIPNSANIAGYTDELIQKGVVQNTGHVVISPQGTEPFGDVRGILRAVGGLADVRAVAARSKRAGVIFVGQRNAPIAAIGIDPMVEQKVQGLCARVEKGSCPDLESNNGLLLGNRIAEQMGLGPGDTARLVLPYQDLGELEFKKRQLPVVGVLGSEGFSTVDLAVFAHIELINEMIEDRDSATSVHVWIEDPWRAEDAAGKIAGAVAGVRVMPWWEVDGFVSGAIKGNKTISAISFAMVSFAVIIPVLALLFIHSLQDRKNVATLMAIGFRRRSIFTLYLLKSVFVGLCGTAVGIVIGFGLCVWFDAHPIFSFRGFVIHPVWSDPLEVIMPLGAVFGVSVLGGVLPALYAAFANPALELKEV